MDEILTSRGVLSPGCVRHEVLHPKTSLPTPKPSRSAKHPRLTTFRVGLSGFEAQKSGLSVAAGQRSARAGVPGAGAPAVSLVSRWGQVGGVPGAGVCFVVRLPTCFVTLSSRSSWDSWRTRGHLRPTRRRSRPSPRCRSLRNKSVGDSGDTGDGVTPSPRSGFRFCSRRVFPFQSSSKFLWKHGVELAVSRGAETWGLLTPIPGLTIACSRRFAPFLQNEDPAPAALSPATVKTPKKPFPPWIFLSSAFYIPAALPSRPGSHEQLNFH